MYRRIFIQIFILAVLTAQFVFAFNWPVTEPVVTSTFGGDKWGAFASGIEISGNGLDVRPSEDGELIFFANQQRPGALPSGIGNFTVIEHDRKLRTLYGSVDSVEELEGLSVITTADVIGVAGVSGKATKPHLYFAVIDSEFEQYVNPLLLLNSIVDNKSPVIRTITLATESGNITVDKKAIVKAGRTEILAEIFDPCMSADFFCPMAPYKIQMFLNGEEIFYLNFESLRVDTGDSMIQSREELTYSSLYRNDGLISLGELSLFPGDSRFEILVSDYSENETTRSFQLTVIE